ncbi:hypothetical protein ACQPZF_41525 [Actinosynnema sp. CS-041913]|uniref:hypothetical protein n=1 Tax=Actinosynnema sp. CS-041913 TaxID=3239917 RepID=UPI003D8E0EA1
MLLYGLLGLAILLVLWPTRAGGNRFLRRWGVADPTEEQALHAVRYLRNRRLLYPPLFLLVPTATSAAADLFRLPAPQPSPLHHLTPIIVALLLAEAIAALRPVRGPRIAMLTCRHWRDLAPRWAMGLLLTFAAVAILLTTAGLLAQPWARRSVDVSASIAPWFRAEVVQPLGILVIIGVTVGMAAVLGVVRPAVRRGSVADPEVDAALRTRSARVALGIGIAWLGWMVILANNRLSALHGLRHSTQQPAPFWLDFVPALGLLGVIALLVSAAGWIWVANPSTPRAGAR